MESKSPRKNTAGSSLGSKKTTRIASRLFESTSSNPHSKLRSPVCASARSNLTAYSPEIPTQPSEGDYDYKPLIRKAIFKNLMKESLSPIKIRKYLIPSMSENDYLDLNRLLCIIGSRDHKSSV